MGIGLSEDVRSQKLLNREQIGAEFSVPDHELDRPGFPEPRILDACPYWDGSEVWSWLAIHAPSAAVAAPLRHWAPTGDPRNTAVRPIPQGVVQDWTIDGLLVRLVWPLAGNKGPDMEAAARLDPPAPLLYAISTKLDERRSTRYGKTGPILDVFSPTGTLTGSVQWVDLALVLGGRAPYWPTNLRVAEAMRFWRAGDPPVRVTPVLPTEVALVRELAARMIAGSDAHRTLEYLVYAVERQAAFRAGFDGRTALGSGGADRLELAAIPSRKPVLPLLNKATRRAGWLEILSMADPLARSVISFYMIHLGGWDLPLPSTEAAGMRPGKPPFGK